MNHFSSKRYAMNSISGEPPSRALQIGIDSSINWVAGEICDGSVVVEF